MIQEGTSQASRNFAPGSRRAAQAAGAAKPASIEPGKNISQKEQEVGAWRSAVGLLRCCTTSAGGRGRPTRPRNASSARPMMAMNQGSTSAANHTMPTSGLSARSQSARRSMTTSAKAASPTTIRMSGPLSKTPIASAVQNIAGSAQVELGVEPRALLWQVEARQHPHGGDHCRQQHGVGGGEPRLDGEQDRACHHQPGQQGGTAGDEGKCRPIGQQHRPDGAEERGHPVEPDRRQRARHAQRPRGRHHAGLQPIDADRLLVAHLVLEPDVDIVAAFRSSAWWPARSAPRHGRSGGSRRSRAGNRAARPGRAMRRRARASAWQNPAMLPDCAPARAVAARSG